MPSRTGAEPFDVVVVGGGVSGVCAAAQAACAGASTLLVERSGRLGGTLANGGISRPGIFHAWGERVISGIGWGMVQRAVEEGGGSMPDFRDLTLPHWRHQVMVSGPLFSAICDGEVSQSGAELLLHAMPASAVRRRGGWDVALCCKEGIRKVRAKVLVDCTGDANLAEMAGARLRQYAECQPGTLSFRLEGYDPSALDMESLDAEFARAVAAGEVEAEDACWNVAAPKVSSLLWNRGSNANHIRVDSSARSSAGRTQIEIAGRASMYRVYKWLKAQPGLEGIKLAEASPEIGVRETATVVGLAEITERDYASGRKWRDAVCYSYYPIDLHSSSLASGLHFVKLTRGRVPTVPRGALVAAGCEGLLVAGRIISSDRLANSALRVQATAMATGQAAGALAALSAKCRQSPQDVPIGKLKKLLRDNGAIVP